MEDVEEGFWFCSRGKALDLMAGNNLVGSPLTVIDRV